MPALARLKPPLPQPSAIQRLFRQWEQARRELKAAAEEEEERIYQKLDHIEELMAQLPCRTAADLALKLVVETRYGEWASGWDASPVWREVRALAGIA